MNLALEEKLKIAYIPLVIKSWLNAESYKIRKKSIKELNKNPKVEIITPDFIVANDSQAFEACKYFNDTHIDAILIHFIGFIPATIITILATEIPAPVILWAVPEPPMNGGRLEINSFCAANLNAFTLKKLKRKYRYILSSPETVWGKLDPIIRVISVIKTLRKVKIGLVGSRVPGFYTSNFNELELRRNFGVEVHYVTLLELIDEADKIEEEEIKKVLPRFNKIERDRVTGDEVLKSIRLYLSFKKLSAKYNLDAYAIKTWPEFGSIYGICIDLCLSLLSTDGLISAEEGDLNGVVGMIINYLLSSEIPFFCDFIKYDEKENTGIVWHSGAASETLRNSNYNGRFCKHFSFDGGNKKGVSYEFPLKSGLVTFSNFGEGENGYRLMLASGNAFDTEQIIKGNPLNIKFDCNVEKLVKTIIYGGYSHHYTVVHKNIYNELIDLCNWLDIEVITI